MRVPARAGHGRVGWPGVASKQASDLRRGRMFWLIVLVVVVVLGALAWWSSGRQRKGVDSRAVQRARKINEGRGSQYGGG